MEEFPIKRHEHLLIRSKVLLPIWGPPILNGALEIRQGLISQIGPYAVIKKTSIRTKFVDLEELIILPPLTNAHVHLELSPLRLRIPPSGKFIHWVRQVIKQKALLSPEEIQKSVRKALQELWQEGVGYLGEITNSALTLEILANSPFRGYIFQEVLNFKESQPLKEIKEYTTNFRITYSAQAPYSVSPLLLQFIKAYNKKKNKTFSIHCGESPEEIEFLLTGKGPLRELLEERGQWNEGFKAPGVSSVVYLHKLGLLDEKTLLVHAVHLSEEDFELLSRYKPKICLCPRSNLYTGVGLANVPKLLEAGLELCLGTDSLASNDKLSIFDEMKTLNFFYPTLSSSKILEMGTVNGAKALSLENKGYLKEGVEADFIAVEVPMLNTCNLDTFLDDFIVGEKRVGYRFYVLP